MLGTRTNCVRGFARCIRDPCPTRRTADFEHPSFIIQHLWLCHTVLQGKNPVPEGMEADVQHQVLCPDEGIVLMPSRRAIPLLMYGICPCVATRHGSVNISSAKPVGIHFAVKIRNIKLVVEGSLTWNSTKSSKWDF